MIMKKNLFYAVVAIGMLASCADNEFLGENISPTTSKTESAIQFGSDASRITRATSNTGTVSEMLDGQFKVYGTKNVKDENDDDAYSKVFPDYVAWNNSSLTATTSNPDANDASNGWEYVGTTSTTYGAENTALTKEQTIKYWDYSAANYHFVAGSPVANFTYTITNNDIVSATVTGLAGHITANSTGTGITTNPVYIAKPVNVIPSDYNKPVTFEFVRQQAKVRVGVYETIPGYKITEIKFYPYGDGDWDNTSGNNIVLASTTANYFQGGASDAVEGTITYDWSTTPASYSFTYNAVTGKTLTQAKNWYGGAYNYAASGSDAAWSEMAITSTGSDIKKLYGTDDDMDAATGYFTVLPTAATTPSALLIKCDYTLTSEVDNSGETITVHGATAAIPAAFCKWAPNTSYTYLFKISDNTNGYTGTTGQPGGLFPITFDAVVMTEETGTEQGTITTVSTPSITTYQVGSVTTTGIEYKAGTDIYLTVESNVTGELNTLYDGGSAVGGVQVYKLSAAVDASPAPTEADLQLTAPTGTDLFTLGSSNVTVNNVSLTANKYGSFSPSEAGYYAIQYLTTVASGTEGQDGYKPAAYTYKIVKVVATGGSGSGDSGSGDSGSGDSGSGDSGSGGARIK